MLFTLFLMFIDGIFLCYEIDSKYTKSWWKSRPAYGFWNCQWKISVNQKSNACVKCLWIGNEKDFGKEFVNFDYLWLPPQIPVYLSWPAGCMPLCHHVFTACISLIPDIKNHYGSLADGIPGVTSPAPGLSSVTSSLTVRVPGLVPEQTVLVPT